MILLLPSTVALSMSGFFYWVSTRDRKRGYKKTSVFHKALALACLGVAAAFAYVCWL